MGNNRLFSVVGRGADEVTDMIIDYSYVSKIDAH